MNIFVWIILKELIVNKDVIQGCRHSDVLKFIKNIKGQELIVQMDYFGMSKRMVKGLTLTRMV